MARKLSGKSLTTLQLLRDGELGPERQTEALRILHRDGYINAPDHTAELTPEGLEVLQVAGEIQVDD